MIPSFDASRTADELVPVEILRRVQRMLEKEGVTYVTILRTERGTWQYGAEVHIVEVDGVNYLRTDRNSRAADNLGDLPEV